MTNADFEPERKVVSAITNANPAVVTATAHAYTTTDIVRINVPIEYGMRLPPEEVTITVINANSFSIDMDTSLLDPFVVPVATPQTFAEVLPINRIDNVAT